MAACKVLVLLLFSCQVLMPEGRGDEESPLMDIATAFLQNMGDGGGGAAGGEGLAALGSIVGSLMQGDNAQHLGALFGQNANNNVAGDVLSGLGSLLTNQEGKIDPSVVGSMISMFAQQVSNSNEHSAAGAKQRTKRQNPQENDVDFGSLLSAASSLFEGQNAAGFLPVLMNTLSSFSGPQAEQRAHNHEDHAWFLPPMLEKLHVYWDHFLNSELGRAIWKQSGLQKAMKSFENPDGKVDFERVLKSLENHSFRRRWIKASTGYLTEFFVYLANPEVQQRYLSSAQYIINGFLTSQGFPKNTMFYPTQPAESVSSLANYVVKKYFNVDADLSIYVKPAFDYLQQILRMAQTTGRKLLTQTDHNALTDRITDTLNLEIIEPVLRVYRAYRHAVRSPHCQEHLMCLLNRHEDSKPLGLPGFKIGLTKLSSLVASAAISYQNGKGFWDLYNAVQEDVNCQAKYPADCSEFHEHEVKVTTEYYHNEL